MVAVEAIVTAVLVQLGVVTAPAAARNCALLVELEDPAWAGVARRARLPGKQLTLNVCSPVVVAEPVEVLVANPDPRGQPARVATLFFDELV